MALHSWQIQTSAGASIANVFPGPVGEGIGDNAAAAVVELFASFDLDWNMRRNELVDERLRCVRTVLEVLKRRGEKIWEIL